LEEALERNLVERHRELLKQAEEELMPQSRLE
jgi:hypothetical protein